MILVYTSEAAILLGATPTDRPEDVEISPFDKTVFIAHTNNDKHGNIHGHITRFLEEGDDLGALTFDFEIFACGGRQSGFSAPDNLTFDREGNLWTVTDISSSSQNKGVFSSFKNNGLFVIPTIGGNEGEAFPICFCTSRSRNDRSMLYRRRNNFILGCTTSRGRINRS